MAWRGVNSQRKGFGSKQPTKVSQVAALKTLICGAASLEALPTATALAHMYRVDPKEVELAIGVERRRRHEADAGVIS
jgi:hypothetical protein